MTKEPAHVDDARMDRFRRDGLDRWSARHSIIAVLVALLVASVLSGASVRRAGERAEPGLTRDTLMIMGRPAAAVENATPVGRWFDQLAQRATGREPASVAVGASRGGEGAASGTGELTLDSIDPRLVDGADEEKARPTLRTVLVTGDSMAMPLDVELARRLAGSGVEVVRDARPGSGISNVAVADWAAVASEQVRTSAPDAVVVFIGANEGYPFEHGPSAVDCCSAEWTLEYARQAGELMRTWSRAGEARIYWIVLPAQRDERRHPVTRAVNHAVDVAAASMRRFVERVDVTGVLTPGDRFADAVDLGDGREVIVRAPDGIHLNDAGSAWVAERIVERFEADYAVGDG